MWEIILSGLVMLNAQPNDPKKPRYDGAENVHVLFVDARSVDVDSLSKRKPIAPHAAVLQVHGSCLESDADPDWRATLDQEEMAFFLLDNVNVRIRAATAQDLEIVKGKRPLDANNEPRLLPCCHKDKDCPSGVNARWYCEKADSVAFVDQRRDLTWVTPMADLTPGASLAPGCLPPRFTGCPLVAWLTIGEGTLQTYRLEGEEPGNTDLTKVSLTKTSNDPNEKPRAAAREILWTLPPGQLTVELASFSGVETIPVTSSCSWPLRIRNEPLHHILHLEEPAPPDRLSDRHAEHLFRLLAAPPPKPPVLSEVDGTTEGSGLCPPGDTGGP